MAKSSRSLRFDSLADMPAGMRAKAEMALAKQAPDVGGVIVIDLPIRTVLFNEFVRMHWAKRRKYCRRLAVLIHECASRRPAVPLQRCRVTVERFSTMVPDHDGLVGSLKSLLDALQPCSARHPYGLGFIADDSPACIGQPTTIHVPGREKRTRITIEPL